MAKQHVYETRIRWTGNTGTGTSTYRAYRRTWEMMAEGKPVLACSNDPLLGGDASCYNPEDLLLSALASCHMLWYLHLCSEAGITVTSYVDAPEAIGEVEPSGRGKFLSATLKPETTIIAGGDLARAHALHSEIHHYCFIARSVNFPVMIEPVISFEE